jgi:hypothetical protein
MRYCVLTLVVIACNKPEQSSNRPAEIPPPQAPSTATPPKTAALPQPATAPPLPLDVTVDQLFTMLTGGVNGPEELKRREDLYRGKEVIMRGTVYESSAESKTITLKGSGMTYADCEFETLPKGFKKGKPATFKGVVSGFFMQVNVDHCSVVAQR